MPIGDTIRVIQPSNRRLKIFIDFWNVIISARDQCSFNVSVKWDALARMLVQETRPEDHRDETAGSLAGCYIFGSFDRSNGPQMREVEAILDAYGPREGLFFELKERVGKETTHKCGSCGTPVQRSSEAGVDIMLTVEMIKHAALREHDYLALVSSDRDFVPLLSYLKDGGQRVIHAAPGQPHRDMRNATWKQVALQDRFPSLCKIENEEPVILYSIYDEERMRQADQIMGGAKRKFKKIDICKKEDISDKDLRFLVRNQGHFLKFKKDRKQEREWNPLVESPLDDMYQFRKSIFDGKLDDGLPYVMYRGQMEAHGDNEWGWVRGSTKYSEIWRQAQSGDAFSV